MDEVDTTDLENWCLKARRPRRKGQVDRLPREFETPEKNTLEEALLNQHIQDMKDEQGPLDHVLAGRQEQEEHTQYLALRHRLNLAKLLLGKDGGYSLRKFKKIFKREMEEQPDRYLLLNKLKTRRVKVIDESKEEGDPEREKWQDEYIVQETKVQKAASKVADDESGEAQAAEADGEDGAQEYDYEKTKEEVTAQFRKELEEIRNETDSEECYDFDEEEIQ